MKKRNNKILTAVLCLITVLLCGCGAGRKSSTEMAVAETAAAAMGSMFEEDAEAFEAGFAQTPDLKDSASAAPTEMAEEMAEQPETLLQSDRKLIRNVSMYVETDSFDALIASITEMAADFGGYIERSDISGQRTSYQGNPIPRSAYYTIRIPSNRLDSFTASVEQGANVINKSETTEDVTLQYSDIESRKKSLTMEQERIWALLEKADSLESVIALEERLSEIRYELESMESRLRLYDNQVDYSTVDLSVDEVTVYTPTAPETVRERIQNGFSRSLHGVSDFFVNLFVVLVAASPIWVPFLVLLLIGVTVLKKWRKKKKASSRKEAEDAGTETKHS